MKRSAGVTAASICLIAASVACFAYFASTISFMAKHGLQAIIAGVAIEMLFALWGAATGIGLLRLRRWAWACVLVISGVILAFGIPTLLGAPKLIRATTGVPTVSAGHLISHQYFQMIEFGVVPLVLGVWWLVFFLRRSVREQFSPAVVPVGGEGSSPLVRSGAVDVSAMLLFFGSAIVLLLGVEMPLDTLTGPGSAEMLPFRGILIVTAAFFLVVTAWGVITGIGVLKRRAWGRALMIVSGAVGIAFAVFGGAGAVMILIITPMDTRLPPSMIRAAFVGEITMLLIPLGVSIWWLVLFTRPRIALEFASAAVASAAAPPTSLPLVAAPPDPTAPVPLQFTVAVSSPAPLTFVRPQIPLSVRVIAVVEILFGALALFGPLQTKFMGMRPPLLIFGFLVHGWGVNAFYIVSGILPIIFGVAILLRKRWGLDALIAVLLAQIVNYALVFVSPARVRFNAELQAQMQQMMAQIKLPAGTKPPPFPFAQAKLFQTFSMGVAMALFIVLLYFLFTRRRAFRTACAPPNSNSNPSASATPNAEVAP